MTAPRDRLRAAGATLVALALAYGLWLASEGLEDQLPAGPLFPLLRVVCVFGGLTLAERLFAGFQSRVWRSR